MLFVQGLAQVGILSRGVRDDEDVHLCCRVGKNIELNPACCHALQRVLARRCTLWWRVDS